MGQKNILCGHVSHPLLEANFFLLPFSAKFLAREFCIQLFPLPNLPSAFFGNFYFYQSTVDLLLNYFSTLMLFNSLFLNTILKLLFCKVYTLSETSYETELSYFLHTYTLSLCHFSYLPLPNISISDFLFYQSSITLFCTHPSKPQHEIYCKFPFRIVCFLFN